MDDISLPEMPGLETIKARLPEIFPEGLDQRNYVIRDIAARTIYVMLYVGAVEGYDRWMRPAQVTMMTESQSGKTSTGSRIEWSKDSLTPGKLKNLQGVWYASNTRESIRDETIKDGLIALGAVIERPGLPTTSSAPRYALTSGFAALFDESISEIDLADRILQWQEANLNVGAMMRIKLLKRGADSSTDAVIVKFPNGESRKMSPGPSSVLSKEVIEIFAPRFLKQPALVFLSESGNKVIAQDNDIASSIGLKIKADKNLPDIILADLGTAHPLIIFVEVVYSDGPISAGRKAALLKLATDAGFGKDHVVFVSAFFDKTSPAFKKLSSVLAWGSFAWFSAEPDNILVYKGKDDIQDKKLFDLLGA